MKDGFIKVAAGSIPVALADPARNAETIIARMKEAEAAGVNLLVLPELCLTGASCGDLFFSDALIRGAEEALGQVADASAELSVVTVVGVPLLLQGKLYNCAATVCAGDIRHVTPKATLDGAQSRWFSCPAELEFQSFPQRRHGNRAAMASTFTTDYIQGHSELTDYRFGVQIGEDESHAAAMCTQGATILVNPAATPELVGARERTRLLCAAASARLCCAYVRAGADVTESTGDVVYGSHHLIAVGGRIVAESVPFEGPDLLIADVDVAALAYDRRRQGAGLMAKETKPQELGVWPFLQPIRETVLTTPPSRTPFVPEDEGERARRAADILNVQARGLARRLSHTHAKTAVIGISGGLDSTLALLVAARAMDSLGRPRTDILAVTMPCFGTTGRTKSNATVLCEELGVTLREINLKATVLSHFADIGQSADNYDVTYENAQARERTQVLMDLANMTGGLVIGTGDLSELALGWATYNGDHMSMYGVNGGLPKTLIRHLVAFEAEQGSAALGAVLRDILDTPVSPELLPADAKGDIAQKTEDLVGPYELHDFFLYYMLRQGAGPGKIYRLAKAAFAGVYEDAVILHWLRTFCRRFFNQQFKRSCLPDGPAVGSVGLSPRGAWVMASDAVWTLWEREIERL